MGQQTVKLKLHPAISSFCKLLSGGSSRTGKTYGSRLNDFNAFLIDKYNIDIANLITSVKHQKLDVYDVLAEYRMLLQSQHFAKSTIINRVCGAKVFLEYNDISISNIKYKLKVRPGTRRKVELQAIAKEDVRKILLGCQDPRLLTYCLLLASTGMRAVEATSVRLQDIDFEKGIIELREDYTKTKQARIVYLTEECIKQLKLWKTHRERERRVVDGNTHKSIKVRRPFKEDDLFFTSGRFERVEEPRYIYTSLIEQFAKVLDRVGFSKRRENLVRQHKVTFHSFRRFVKTQISDRGYQDFSEWFIGHSGSTYWRKTEREKLEIFKKIEPYLTYLDYKELDAKASDFQTELESKGEEMQKLRVELREVKSELAKFYSSAPKVLELNKRIDELARQVHKG